MSVISVPRKWRQADLKRKQTYEKYQNKQTSTSKALGSGSVVQRWQRAQDARFDLQHYTLNKQQKPNPVSLSEYMHQPRKYKMDLWTWLLIWPHWHTEQCSLRKIFSCQNNGHLWVAEYSKDASVGKWSECSLGRTAEWPLMGSETWQLAFHALSFHCWNQQLRQPTHRQGKPSLLTVAESSSPWLVHGCGMAAHCRGRMQ